MSTPARPLVACHHCGDIFTSVALRRGETASCDRCGSVLWRYSALSPQHWLALVLSALLVFAVANYFPVAQMSVRGMVRSATLLDAVVLTWRQNHEIVAVMTGLSGFVLPLLQLTLLLWVLLPMSFGRRAVGFRTAMRLLGLIRPWCMVPVFLLGVVVSVVKLADMARVEAGIGIVAFGLLTVFLTMFSRLSPHSIWRYAERSGVVESHVPDAQPDHLLAGCHVCGQVQNVSTQSDAEALHHCVRCNAVLHVRKPDHVARTWALVFAASICYIPANLLPVMRIDSLLGSSEHTILGGVIELWNAGGWDIAIIVFVASVVVPLFKLLALVALLIGVQRRSPDNLRGKTRLYEAVEFIGQWSMLDVFVVILLAALANFHGLMQIAAGSGAAAFGAVVIFTMLAAMSFDPRRSWDHSITQQGDDSAAPASPTSEQVRAAS